MTALEALSAGIPFLVSQNSGFGEALQEIQGGSAFIVDSENPEDWAKAIKAARLKGSDTVFQQCQELRALYAEKYKWEEQSQELVTTMKLLINGECCILDDVQVFLEAQMFKFLLKRNNNNNNNLFNHVIV